MRSPLILGLVSMLVVQACSRSSKPGSGAHAPQQRPGVVCPEGTTHFGGRPPVATEEGCLLGGKKHGSVRRYDDNGALIASQVFRRDTLIRERLYSSRTGRLNYQFDGDDQGLRKRTRTWEDDAPWGALPTNDWYELGEFRHGLNRNLGVLICFDQGKFVWESKVPSDEPCPTREAVEWDTGLPDGDEDYANADGGL